MKTEKALRSELAALVGSQRALVETAEKEKREFTAEETTEFDSLETQIKDKRSELQRRIDYDDNLRTQAKNAPSAMGGEKPEEKEERQLMKRYSLHRALDAHAEGRALTGVEKEVTEEIVKRASKAGVIVEGLAVPTGLEKRFAGQSVTQDSGEYGAALVETENAGLIDFLRPKPILESVGATYFTDLQADVKFIVNEGGITAYWEGEVDAGATSKNKYSNKTMKPKRLTAIVPISIQVLRQSSIDLEAYTRNQIAQAMANALDTAAINGSGTNDQPLGLLNTPNVPIIAIGTNGGALTWGQIVDMETRVFVENANAAKMGYVINPVTKGKLKKTKHEAGDLGYLMAGDNTINGYSVGVSNLVPGDLTKGTGTNLSAALFGDFSQLIIGQWGFVDLVVDKSTAGSGYYNIIVNGFYDVMVRQPKAFVGIKDISNA